jgi:hypothetical protein
LRVTPHSRLQVSGMKQSSGAEIPSNLSTKYKFIPRPTSYSQN